MQLTLSRVRVSVVLPCPTDRVDDEACIKYDEVNLAEGVIE
jgi:hypothetical protein